MVKVKLPDIRKNKLSVIIKSLERKDVALQKFQRRDLYNAKAVKVVENTQIELYLPNLIDSKGKPTWNHSTQVNGGRHLKQGGRGEGAGASGHNSNAKAGGGENAGTNSQTNNTKGVGGPRKGVAGRKIPQKSPSLSNQLKTLRTDDGKGGLHLSSSTSNRSKDKESSGVGATKVEMIFKPTQAVMKAKESQRFSTGKTNMMSLKSWNQNNPTEAAYHWLSSGPGGSSDYTQVDAFQGSLKRHMAGKNNMNMESSSSLAHTNGEKYTVSMVKPSLPEVNTSPPRSHVTLEQILEQKDQKRRQASGSETSSPTKNNAEMVDFDQLSPRSYQHREFSSYRDNSHIQGNIMQQHARIGRDAESLIDNPFIVKSQKKNKDKTGGENSSAAMGKNNASSLLSSSLCIEGSKSKKLSKRKSSSPIKSPSQISSSLPPVDPKTSASAHPDRPASIVGVFMPHRYQQVQNVDEDYNNSHSNHSNLETSPIDLMDSVMWLSAKSTLAKSNGSGSGGDGGGGGESKEATSSSSSSAYPKAKTPSPQSIISRNRISPSRQKDYSRITTRHGMIPDRVSKAVLYPLQLRDKPVAGTARESARSIKGLSIAAKKPAARN